MTAKELVAKKNSETGNIQENMVVGHSVLQIM